MSLAKLAITKLEEGERPLRIAIDISIWQFQAQAARGGVNPAIRTLFYRLLRLLSLSIQPIFVFDGPNKPAFKRNKRSGRGDGLSSAMAKRLLNLFGCLIHDAPGEAEAECALLQRQGIVDAVLSEDVDTIMFGCTQTLRNWSAEGTKGSKTPTHISVYDTEDIAKIAPGLDREGMVLVALMSGGDYIPEGIPGAGIKLACEAATAGFGTSLCKLKRADTSGLTSWKEWLIYELRTNESGFFRTRHKALSIPEDFPNFDILRYYTHPVVSPQAVLDSLRKKQWRCTIDIAGLREFSRETFDWDYRGGAFKFIRVLAPVLLVQRLLNRSEQPESQSRDVAVLESEEQELIKAISSRRAHFSTDATPELRVSFIPTELVGHAFEEEPEEVIEAARDGLALNSDDETDVEDGDMEAGAKPGSKKPFSPTEPELVWLPETIAKLGVPLAVENWESAQRAKLARKSQKGKATTTKAKKPEQKNTGAGGLDRFVRVTKALPKENALTKGISAKTQSTILATLDTSIDTVFSPSAARPAKSSTSAPKTRPAAKGRGARPGKASRSDSARNNVSGRPKMDIATNPWTIAGSQVSPKNTRTTTGANPILIGSSPLASPAMLWPSHVTTVENTDQSASASSPPVPFSRRSPQKRRSATPPSELQRSSGGSSDLNPPPSPTPQRSARASRKLARTESMPAAPSPGQVRQPGPRLTRGLIRAHTVAVDVVELEDSDVEDLPAISTMIGRIPGSKIPAESTTSTPRSPRRKLFASTDSASPSKQATTSATKSTQQMKMTNFAKVTKSNALSESVASEKDSRPFSKSSAANSSRDNPEDNDAFGSRMTKMYVPSERTLGFYREIAVTVEEAEAYKEGRTALGMHALRRDKAWRRSDISCIDLTGEE